MFRLDVISRYRAQIYGMLALWIVPLHIWIDYGVDYTCGNALLAPLAWCLESGVIAVDAFLLISGISLCWAYGKKQNLEGFYLRRFMRVFPSALIIYGIYWFITLGILKGDWGRFLWQCMFLNPLVHDRSTSNWFITGILVLYLCYPAFHRLFCESEHRTRNLVFCILGWYVLCGFLSVYAPEWFWLTEILLTRFPIFMLGTYLGPFVRENKAIPTWLVLLSYPFVIVSFVCMFELKPTGTWLWRLPLFLGGIGAVVLDGVLLELIDRNGLSKGILSPVWRFLGWVGSFSLELYCAHQVWRLAICGIVGYDVWDNAYLMLAVVYALSIPTAWAVNRFVAHMRAKHEEKLALA